MTARERIVATIEGQTTDRVPIFDMIHHTDLLERVTGKPVTPDNGLDLLCETLSQCVDMTRGVGPPAADKTWKDDEGFVYRAEWWTTWIVERPFSDVPGACEFIRRNIDRLASMPKDSLYTFYGQGDVWTHDFEDPNQAHIDLQAKLENVVLMPPESAVGLDIAHHRLGIELFVYAYAEEPDLVSQWLDALNLHEVERVRRCADAQLAPVTLVYADLADKNAPLFSPDFLRREFFPRLKRLVDAWHDHGVRVIYHSDGDYRMLLDDFKAAGVEGINPVEYIEGEDHLKDCREGWPEFTLMGGIDSSNLLPYGSQTDVENAVKHAIDVTRPGGRYILGSTTELHPACSVSNILTMWDTALDYGRR